jgi:hypothetical protein
VGGGAGGDVVGGGGGTVVLVLDVLGVVEVVVVEVVVDVDIDVLVVAVAELAVVVRATLGRVVGAGTAVSGGSLVRLLARSVTCAVGAESMVGTASSGSVEEQPARVVTAASAAAKELIPRVHIPAA